MTKAPTQPEYVKWDGGNLAEIRQFLGDQCVSADSVLHLVVNTPDGTDVMMVSPNSWLRRDGSKISVQADEHETAASRTEAIERDPPLEALVDSLAYEGGFD